MSDAKQAKLNYVIILLLFANTLFLGGIFFTLQNCVSMCPQFSSASGKICPWSKKSGSMKGSNGSMGSQKGSM